MIYCTEQLVGDYLLPQIAAIKCDGCQMTETDPTKFEFFEVLGEGENTLDLCPTCFKQPSMN